MRYIPAFWVLFIVAVWWLVPYQGPVQCNKALETKLTHCNPEDRGLAIR